MASTCTSMPMIRRFTSTLRPRTLSHCSSRRMSRCMSRRYRGLTDSQLSLNPTKTQVMWLGSPAAAEVPVTSTRIDISEMACDLVVVIDSQLLLFARWLQCGYQLRQLWPLVRSMSTKVVKTLVQAFISYHLGTVLLQLSVLRHHQRSDEPMAVCPECSCTFGVRHLTVQVPWSTCHCPAHLAADYQFASDEGRRQLRSTASSMYVVRRTYGNYLFQLQLICDKLTLNFNDLNGYWKNFCSVAEIAAYCE